MTLLYRMRKLQKLPNEITEMILEYLEWNDLLVLRETCRYIETMITEFLLRDGSKFGNEIETIICYNHAPIEIIKWVKDCDVVKEQFRTRIGPFCFLYICVKKYLSTPRGRFNAFGLFLRKLPRKQLIETKLMILIPDPMWTEVISDLWNGIPKEERKILKLKCKFTSLITRLKIKMGLLSPRVLKKRNKIRVNADNDNDSERNNVAVMIG